MAIKNEQIEDAAKRLKPGRPSVGANEGSWCTDTVGGVVEGFYIDSAGRSIQVTSGGQLNLGTITGEANDGANDGISGHGIYNGKSGTTLHFKKIIAGENISVTPSVNGLTIAAILPSSFGEANTASNIGLSGVGLFKQKTGVNFEFRRIKAGSNVSLAYSATGDEIEISAVASGGSSNTVTNLGTSADGEGLYSQTIGSEFQFKRIKAGNGILLSPSGNSVEISSSFAGTVTGGANLGATGAGVYAATATGTMNFRKIVAGTNIAIQENAENITITATGTGSINNADNAGTVSDGFGVFMQKSGDILDFYRIKAGTGILVTQTGNSLTITNTGGSGGGGIAAGANLGTGQGSVFAQVNGSTMEYRTLRQGSNVTLSQSATEITINAASDVTNAANMGSTSGRVGLWNDKNSGVLRFKSLVAGTGIALDTTVAGEIRVDAVGGGGGEINTASNVGTGVGVYKQKSGVDLQFKTLKAGNNITLDNSTDPNEVIINSSGGGGGSSIIFCTESRYLAGGDPGELVYVTSASTVYTGLSWTRSGTSMTITHENHGRSVGEMAIVRNTNSIEIASIITGVTTNTFTITVSDSGATSGSAGAYSMGATYAHNAVGITKTGGTLSVPANSDVKILSLRLRTGPRTGTTYLITLPANGLINGAGENASLDTFYFPAFNVRQATQFLPAVGATMAIDNAGTGFNVMSMAALGTGTDLIMNFNF